MVILFEQHGNYFGSADIIFETFKEWLENGKLISMNFPVKRLVKDLSPPLLLRGGRALLHLIQKSSYEEKPEESSGEKSSDWYDQSFVSTDYCRHYTESRYYFLWSVIADRMARARVFSVLDVGCGTGQLADLLRYKGVTDYVGIDFSPKRIERAKSTCPDFTFIVTDAFQTDLFETFHYEGVVCTEFLEHVEQDIEIITRIRAGTRFFGTVPNFPYTSHVRHFKSSAEVFSRYAQYFNEFGVDSFAGNAAGRTYYLFEGIKS
jgi:SAM-dependent methyltransferase